MATGGLLCWSCGRTTGIDRKVFRNDECPHCMAALRCCRGCRHFDPTRRFQCRESIEYNVADKEKPNLCDFFQMRDAIKRPGGVSHQTDDKAERRQKFDDLFND